MFKVSKIEEKLNLDDLKVNDSNPCKADWKRSIGIENLWQGDVCQHDCCSDCTAKGHSNSYISDYY